MPSKNFEPTSLGAQTFARWEQFINKNHLSDLISANKIRSAAWNARDHNDILRLTSILMPRLKKKSQEPILLDLLMATWNHFPHRVMDGFSPDDRVHQREHPASDPPRDQSVSIVDLLANSLPGKSRIIKLDAHRWGFEFSPRYHAAQTEFLDLRSKGLEDLDSLKQLVGLIKRVPELFDAVNELALQATLSGENEFAEEIFEVHLGKGVNMMPREFDHTQDQLPWTYLDNRPYLRLMGEYGAFMMTSRKHPEAAIKVFERLLLLNPNDNQGNRSLLATCYLHTNQPDALLALAQNYPDDHMMELAMGSVLALIWQKRLPAAKKAFHKVNKRYPRVAKELLKTKHPKPKNLVMGKITMGGPDQAWYYWQDQGRFWTDTPGALGLLREWTKI